MSGASLNLNGFARTSRRRWWCTAMSDTARRCVRNMLQSPSSGLRCFENTSWRVLSASMPSWRTVASRAPLARRPSFSPHTPQSAGRSQTLSAGIARFPLRIIRRAAPRSGRSRRRRGCPPEN
jgi:hypothetical protein